MDVVRINTENRGILKLVVDSFLNDNRRDGNFSHLESLLTDDRTYLYAALQDNDVIGYALAYRFPSLYEPGYLAYLYDIEVAEKDRRKGAGRMIMEIVLRDLKADGITELWLGTAVDNVEGQALFSRTGGIRSDEAFNDFTYELN
jgi:ribosomal protein S18 acetylase RimI-like enzyme